MESRGGRGEKVKPVSNHERHNSLGPELTLGSFSGVVQSSDEPPARMSPQPSLKRKKLDDDDLSGSKKARTRVRLALLSSKHVNLSDTFSEFNPATPAESAIVVSKKYVQNLHH